MLHEYQWNKYIVLYMNLRNIQVCTVVLLHANLTPMLSSVCLHITNCASYMVSHFNTISLTETQLIVYSLSVTPSPVFKRVYIPNLQVTEVVEMHIHSQTKASNSIKSDALHFKSFFPPCIILCSI